MRMRGRFQKKKKKFQKSEGTPAGQEKDPFKACWNADRVFEIQSREYLHPHRETADPHHRKNSPVTAGKQGQRHKEMPIG